MRHANLSVLVLVLLSGCQRPVPVPGVVTMAVDNPPTNFDVRIATDATSERLFQLIFSSLVRKDDKSDIQPDLAERWEVPDPTTYIFHLRRGVRFHDGRALTSRDVVYTFRSLVDGSMKTAKAGTYRLVDRVEAPDDYTVTFHLKEPYAPFVWNLATGAFGVVPEGTADASRQPIGSGPFEFVRYIQDNEVVLRRNDRYYGHVPKVSEVRFKIIPEAVTRALELRKGSVDIALNVLTPDMVEVLRNQPDLEVVERDGTNYQYIAFNLEDPVFRDLRVRKAIAHSIDRESIAKHLWRNQVRLATGLIPPNNWAYEGDVAQYPLDREAARRLLADAGRTGLRFTYRTSTDDVARLLAAVLQQQLRESGIQMDIQSNEFATFYADVVKGNFQAYSLRWIGGNNDPDMFNFVFHSAMAPPRGANRGRYSNALVDRLIDDARRTVERVDRRRMYSEIQKIVADELPYVSLWYLSNVAVYNRRVSGMRLYPAGEFEFLTEIEAR